MSVLYGRTSGLAAAGSQFWHQDRPGAAGTAAPHEGFGSALAAANFGQGARADLAVGAPFAANEAGEASVFYGGSAGLSTAGNQLWRGSGRANEWFGAALAGADLDGNGLADLAVGVPLGNLVAASGEQIGDAGWVAVVYGRSSGLSASGIQFWHQARKGIADDIEPRDRFGSALAAAAFGNGRRGDLAVGVPLEDVGTVGTRTLRASRVLPRRATSSGSPSARSASGAHERT